MKKLIILVAIIATLSTTVVLAATSLPEDVNSDNVVDLIDVILVVNDFGTIQSGPNENGIYTDIDRDGVVDLTDVLLVANKFGQLSP